jgi:hypothetical protein
MGKDPILVLLTVEFSSGLQEMMAVEAGLILPPPVLIGNSP